MMQRSKLLEETETETLVFDANGTSASPSGDALISTGAGRPSPTPSEATPTSAEEFYAKFTARPDVREILKRLADA